MAYNGNNAFSSFDNLIRNVTILANFFDIQIINDFTNFVRISYELNVARIGSVFCKFE